MTKEFEDKIEAAFENDDVNEIERAETLIEMMGDKIEEIDECLEAINPENEPGLVKVHATLDHMRDLLAMVAGSAAANIEIQSQEYEAHRAAGAYDEEDEAGDIDLS